ncbi:MAG: hypothetical protein Q7T01_02295 [bacterium]|nr:hypothetical protein [bacterium]
MPYDAWSIIRILLLEAALDAGIVASALIVMHARTVAQPVLHWLTRRRMTQQHA